MSLALQVAPMPGKAAAHGFEQLAMKLEGSQAPKDTSGVKIPVEGERWEVSSSAKC